MNGQDASGTSSTVLVTRIQSGGAIPKQCSNTGICDTSNGECKCWDFWGSSDGFGNDGSLGDCGSNLIA